MNDINYPKFVAMFLTAKIGDKYYDLGDSIPSFNAIAALNPQVTMSATAAPFTLGKEITHLFHK